MNPLYLGIDGCKAGWFVVALDNKGSIHMDVFPDIQSICQAFTSAQRLLIDIPIGLPHRERRSCDSAARKVLSPFRASSVFPVPSRKSLYASSYQEACDINFALMGKKLSKQSWNIASKITEVDRFLRKNTAYRGLIRECHPEVAFWNFNGRSAMPHSKKTAEGQEERLSLISSHLPSAAADFEAALNKWPRKVLAKDDILDAMMLAISASFPLLSLPEKPVIDREGLPMEIVYADV